VLRNARDKNLFLFLARQVYSEDSNSLYRAYLDATEEPHGYLMLDLAQDTNDKLRFRTRIFPTETSIIYTYIKGEKYQVKL